MLFMFVHTHSAERCLSDKPEQLSAMSSEIRKRARETGVKFPGIYVSPNEHTFFFLIESDDFQAIQQTIAPLILWGNGRLIPVSDATLPREAS